MCLCRAQSDFLSKKLEEVEGKLQEAKMGRRENDRDRKMVAALTAMKNMLPGESLGLALPPVMVLKVWPGACHGLGLLPVG